MRSSPEEEVVPGQEVDGEVRLAEDDVDLAGKTPIRIYHRAPRHSVLKVGGGGIVRQSAYQHYNTQHD